MKTPDFDDEIRPVIEKLRFLSDCFFCRGRNMAFGDWSDERRNGDIFAGGSEILEGLALDLYRAFGEEVEK